MRSQNTDGRATGSLLQRIGWFIVLWAGGVAALALAASLLKAFMHAAGMQ